jgi:hypothetical protein
MQLSDADKQKITEWIAAKCGQMRCVCCGNGKWILFDFATLSIGFDVHTTRFYYHQGLPQITIACQDCGHLVFFSPGILGLKPDEPEPENIPAENTEA